MPSHKSEDYKITAVKFHLENESSFKFMTQHVKNINFNGILQ